MSDHVDEITEKSKIYPDFIQRRHAHCSFDSPVSPIRRAVQSFSGWVMARTELDVGFTVNGAPVGDVRLYERVDVVQIANGYFCTGWEFTIDIARHMTLGQHVIVIEAVSGGRPFSRSVYRCDLPGGFAPQKDLVAFIHVPKSGGTSLRNAIERHADDFVLLRSYNDVGHYPTRLLPELSALAYQTIDGVYGHFSYGFHRKMLRKTRYISMIRNPYETIISFYFFARYVQKQEKILDCVDIYDALERRLDPCLDNLCTRMFSGIPEESTVDADAYARAIEHIEQDFEFIGVMEDYRATLDRIGRYLGLSLPHLHENVTGYTQEQEILDIPRLRSFAVPYVKYDLALYEFVLKRFWGAGNHHPLDD